MRYNSNSQRKAVMASIVRGSKVKSYGVIGFYEGEGKKGHVIRTHKNVIIVTKKTPVLVKRGK